MDFFFQHSCFIICIPWLPFVICFAASVSPKVPHLKGMKCFEPMPGGPCVNLFYGPFLQAHPSYFLQAEIPFSSGVAVWISKLKTSPSIKFMFSVIFKLPSDLETWVLFVEVIKAHMPDLKAFQNLHPLIWRRVQFLNTCRNDFMP